MQTCVIACIMYILVLYICNQVLSTYAPMHLTAYALHMPIWKWSFNYRPLGGVCQSFEATSINRRPAITLAPIRHTEQPINDVTTYLREGRGNSLQTSRWSMLQGIVSRPLFILHHSTLYPQQGQRLLSAMIVDPCLIGAYTACNNPPHLYYM